MYGVVHVLLSHIEILFGLSGDIDCVKDDAQTCIHQRGMSKLI
jgi:hypothetical protein